MTAKHVGLLLLLVGMFCLIGAWKMDKGSSFDNGSFIVEIGAICSGLVLIIAGLLTAIFL